MMNYDVKFGLLGKTNGRNARFIRIWVWIFNVLLEVKTVGINWFFIHEAEKFNKPQSFITLLKSVELEKQDTI